MSRHRSALLSGLMAVLVLMQASGCASRTPMPERDIDDIHEQSYREGGRDAIHMLRDAMREHGYHGMHDRERRTHLPRGANE